MGRKKKKKNKNKGLIKEKMRGKFSLPNETKQWILGILLVLLAVIISLSFFGKSGIAGDYFIRISRFLIGETIFIIPLIFILGALIFLIKKQDVKEKKVFWPIILAILFLILGISGILAIFNTHIKQGGWVGYVLSWPFLEYFGFWASLFIFLTPIIIGGLIFWQFLYPFSKKKQASSNNEEEKDTLIVDAPQKTSIIKKIFAPKFKVEKISSDLDIPKEQEEQIDNIKLETKSIIGTKVFSYRPPPINFLEKQKGIPNSGDTKVNADIIKKTLQHFGIEVTMSEINIGPTVTQYSFKPAEGIKLSKITGLSNDLSLALASHPIRIEAPIPGRSLVGVEIPNKIRAQVGLRDLIENPGFQKSSANLLIPLGKDVSGFPVYTDLTKMPHMLVAGSTGTGKTIFLNSLILSLLYQPSTSVKSASPEHLRLILIDPKRVEFPVFGSLPHLLCPIIYNATQTVNAMKWLTGEMERRFDVLAEEQVRDIGGFNEKALRDGVEPLPFIVVIIDELADLMMTKGREIESGIVRLAQMARAVGIHLVIATQRPSVEVITGLIKANIISRVSFQVASQIDSRTILDTSGAEKLLGSGDLLFISALVPKPKRIQGAYISEKEVRKVVKSISIEEGNVEDGMDQELIEELKNGFENPEKESTDSYIETENDPLFEDAKALVIESKKASASLLQRRLRLGYARAARLIDVLESKGIVGPSDGAKPRQVYGDVGDVGDEIPDNLEEISGIEETSKDGDWEKI
ncbi:MAG: DNA translocase FtsK [Candidatus Nealsonbacteria bacterium]